MLHENALIWEPVEDNAENKNTRSVPTKSKVRQGTKDLLEDTAQQRADKCRGEQIIIFLLLVEVSFFLVATTIFETFVVLRSLATTSLTPFWALNVKDAMLSCGVAMVSP